MEREAGFSGFMGETLSLIGDTAIAVAAYVVLLGGLNAIGVALGLVELDEYAARIGFSINADLGTAAVAFQLALFAVDIVALYYLQARMLEVRHRLHPGNTRIWAYLGMNVLSVLAFVLGLLLLIVPGIILLVRWSAASGFVIGARKGAVESLGVSWDATRGHGWSIFFAGLVLYFGFAVIIGALTGLAAVSESEWPFLITSSFVESASNAGLAAFEIGVYLLLSRDSTELGEVFK